MHQPSFTASIANINTQPVTLIEPTPEQLTVLLDEIGKPRITFADSIRIQATSSTALMHVLSIVRNVYGYYTAPIQIYNEHAPMGIEQLPAHAISAIMQRLRTQYINKVK